MDQGAPPLPLSLQDRSYESAPNLPLASDHGHAYIERERLAGFPSLTAIQRHVALEFVLSGATLKALAEAMEFTLGDIRRMFGDPIVRAFISELQKEYAIHRLLTEQWVETQILKNLPKFEGEEPVPVVTRDGDEVMRRKFHGRELIALYKAFGGNADQKKSGGVHVTIDFGSMGVAMPSTVIDVDPQR